MQAGEFQELCELLGLGPMTPEGGEPGSDLSEEDRRAFCAAWGLAPTEGGGVAQAIAQLRRDRWEQVIPPALVLGEESGPIVVPLRLPEALMARPLHWQLVQENGESIEGTAHPAELALLTEARLEGERYAAFLWTLDHRLPAGYHRLTAASGDGTDRGTGGACTLIITPSRCYTPPGLLREARLWGLNCHLAAVRSRRNWGCGDLTDLHTLLGWAAENGAGTVTVSSLLSSRVSEGEPPAFALPSAPCFPDPLYLDLEAVADFHESEEARALVGNPAFQVRLVHLRETGEVDYREVAALKMEAAGVLWRHFQLNHLNPETERGWSYRRFQEAGGQRLHDFALYEALREDRRAGAGQTAASGAWPAFPRDPASPTAAAFAGRHRDRIEFYQYLQWQLELQLAEAGKRSMELGLKVGLTLTLPAGIDSLGFPAWAEPSLFGKGLQVHDHATDGSCRPCGPPVLPSRMAATAYASFIAMLRANMRHAGALCFNAIDRMERQLWRRENSEGPGVEAVLASGDLLGIIALESVRNHCLVIGEHQGELSETFAETLRSRGILVSRPGFFARIPDNGGWLAPSRYPAESVLTANSSDLCSLDGFWRGRDIALLAAHCSCFDDRARERAIIARASDRVRLLVALKHENLLPPGHDLDPAVIPEMTPALIRAVYAFLVRAPSKILLVHLADLAALIEEEAGIQPVQPVELPKLRADLESLTAAAPLQQMFREFCLERVIGVIRPSASLADRRNRQGHALPRAFYRLQFNKDCTFRRAAAILPYLRELGISHCYASPYLKARPGSVHGYDIIDHCSLNPEIGSREDYEAFVAALDHNGMAQILDMVPNHMGVGPDNGWWVDVLENGPASQYADFFDINWQSREEGAKRRLLLPVLGDHFGVVLEDGSLRLVFLPVRGGFFIAYYEHSYPLDPATYPLILSHDLERLEARLGSQHEGLLELQSLIASFASLPGREETDPEQMELRGRNKEVLKRLLARLCREVPEVAVFIEENVLFFNGEPGRPESFNLLEKLLAMQAFRLAFWRVASDEINYRRFFDINDLAGIRMERQEVFDQTHRLVLDLIATGKIDGLRIDHPDGLYDPEHYFRTLQRAVSGLSPEREPPLFPEGENVRGQQDVLPLYVVVEKILAEFEQLPGTWMVNGTTGYDFSCLLNGLFIDRSAEEAMTAMYHQFIGREIDFAVLAHDCKRLIIKTAMAGEINVLSDQLHRMAKRNRYTQDYTLNGLREALTEIVAFFPVYRTYCTTGCLDPNDRRHVELAVDRAKARWQVEETSIYDFIKSMLLFEATPQTGGRQDRGGVDFVKKFQQYTGPIMAKGLEDTAFYIYNRLVSLNEVGDDPCRFGVTVAAFHAANLARAEKWPHAMLTTSTHDSKRSEDVRARINVLSELSDQWRQAVDRWHMMNRGKKTAFGQGAAPSKNDEYALYQNLLGVWPMSGAADELFRERFTAYMLKVVREAKVQTSWLRPNIAYEEAMTNFIGKLLDGEDRAFLDDFIAFQHKTARFGMINSLSQMLLKLAAPGIPDIYQGNEIWQYCLVDPDNRRPVDFEERKRLLDRIKRCLEDAASSPVSRLDELLEHAGDGGTKMYVLWKALALRQENPDLFLHGAYLPLQAVGPAQAHLCAFARVHGGQTVVAAVPRLAARLLQGDADRLPIAPEVWGETRLLLPDHLRGCRLSSRLNGEELAADSDKGRGLPVADLFRHLPVALLTNNGVPA